MNINEIKKNLSVERVLLGKIFEYSQTLENTIDAAMKAQDDLNAARNEIEKLKEELKQIREKEIMLNVEH